MSSSLIYVVGSPLWASATHTPYCSIVFAVVCAPLAKNLVAPVDWYSEETASPSWTRAPVAHRVRADLQLHRPEREDNKEQKDNAHYTHLFNVRCNDSFGVHGPSPFIEYVLLCRELALGNGDDSLPTVSCCCILKRTLLRRVDKWPPSPTLAYNVARGFDVTGQACAPHYAKLLEPAACRPRLRIVSGIYRWEDEAAAPAHGELTIGEMLRRYTGEDQICMSMPQPRDGSRASAASPAVLEGQRMRAEDIARLRAALLVVSEHMNAPERAACEPFYAGSLLDAVASQRGGMRALATQLYGESDAYVTFVSLGRGGSPLLPRRAPSGVLDGALLRAIVGPCVHIDAGARPELDSQCALFNYGWLVVPSPNGIVAKRDAIEALLELRAAPAKPLALGWLTLDATLARAIYELVASAAISQHTVVRVPPTTPAPALDFLVAINAVQRERDNTSFIFARSRLIEETLRAECRRHSPLHLVEWAGSAAHSPMLFGPRALLSWSLHSDALHTLHIVPTREYVRAYREAAGAVSFALFVAADALGRDQHNLAPFDCDTLLTRVVVHEAHRYTLAEMLRVMLHIRALLPRLTEVHWVGDASHRIGSGYCSPFYAAWRSSSSESAGVILHKSMATRLALPPLNAAASGAAVGGALHAELRALRYLVRWPRTEPDDAERARALKLVQALLAARLIEMRAPGVPSPSAFLLCSSSWSSERDRTEAARTTAQCNAPIVLVAGALYCVDATYVQAYQRADGLTDLAACVKVPQFIAGMRNAFIQAERIVNRATMERRTDCEYMAERWLTMQQNLSLAADDYRHRECCGTRNTHNSVPELLSPATHGGLLASGARTASATAHAAPAAGLTGELALLVDMPASAPAWTHPTWDDFYEALTLTAQPPLVLIAANERDICSMLLRRRPRPASLFTLA